MAAFDTLPCSKRADCRANRKRSRLIATRLRYFDFGSSIRGALLWIVCFEIPFSLNLFQSDSSVHRVEGNTLLAFADLCIYTLINPLFVSISLFIEYFIYLYIYK